MAIQLGTYFFDEHTGFPAVVIKTLENGYVLVRVWTESGDMQLAAPKGDTPAPGVFIPDG